MSSKFPNHSFNENLNQNIEDHPNNNLSDKNISTSSLNSQHSSTKGLSKFKLGAHNILSSIQKNSNTNSTFLDNCPSTSSINERPLSSPQNINIVSSLNIIDSPSNNALLTSKEDINIINKSSSQNDFIEKWLQGEITLDEKKKKINEDGKAMFRNKELYSDSTLGSKRRIISNKILNRKNDSLLQNQTTLNQEPSTLNQPNITIEKKLSNPILTIPSSSTSPLNSIQQPTHIQSIPSSDIYSCNISNNNDNNNNNNSNKNSNPFIIPNNLNLPNQNPNPIPNNNPYQQPFQNPLFPHPHSSQPNIYNPYADNQTFQNIPNYNQYQQLPTTNPFIAPFPQYNPYNPYIQYQFQQPFQIPFHQPQIVISPQLPQQIPQQILQPHQPLQPQQSLPQNETKKLPTESELQLINELKRLSEQLEEENNMLMESLNSKEVNKNANDIKKEAEIALPDNLEENDEDIRKINKEIILLNKKIVLEEAQQQFEHIKTIKKQENEFLYWLNNKKKILQEIKINSIIEKERNQLGLAHIPLESELLFSNNKPIEEIKKNPIINSDLNIIVDLIYIPSIFLFNFKKFIFTFSVYNNFGVKVEENSVFSCDLVNENNEITSVGNINSDSLYFLKPLNNENYSFSIHNTELISLDMLKGILEIKASEEDLVNSGSNIYDSFRTIAWSSIPLLNSSLSSINTGIWVYHTELDQVEYKKNPYDFVSTFNYNNISITKPLLMLRIMLSNQNFENPLNSLKTYNLDSLLKYYLPMFSLINSPPSLLSNSQRESLSQHGQVSNRIPFNNENILSSARSTLSSSRSGIMSSRPNESELILSPSKSSQNSLTTILENSSNNNNELAQPIQRSISSESNDLEIKSSSMWFKNGPPSFSPIDLYKRGDGIDLYIDSARGLPDNCTITRISARIFSTKSKEQIGSTIEGITRMDTLSSCFPIYNLKNEVRLNNISNSAFILFRIDTIDSLSLSFSSIGYSFLPIFCSKDRDMEDENNDDNENALVNNVNLFFNTGLFQLPIYGGKLSPKSFLSPSYIKSNCPIIPCASLLVRLLIPKKSFDGITPLNLADYPRNAWLQKEVIIKPPKYSSSKYYNKNKGPDPSHYLGFSIKQDYNNCDKLCNTFLKDVEENCLYDNLENINRNKKSNSHLTLLSDFFIDHMKLNSNLNNNIKDIFDNYKTYTSESNDDTQLSNELLEDLSNLNTDEVMLFSPKLVYWWRKKIFPPVSSIKDILDYSLTLPYSIDCGLNIKIISLQNMDMNSIIKSHNKSASNIIKTSFFNSVKLSVVYKVITTIYPPGLYYHQYNNNNELNNNHSYTKWTHKNSFNCHKDFPEFNDSYFNFSPSFINDNSYAIFEIQPYIVEYSKKKGVNYIKVNNKNEKIWTILPLNKKKIFNYKNEKDSNCSNYLNYGYFRLPLFIGKIPNTNEIQNNMVSLYDNICKRLEFDDSSSDGDENKIPNFNSDVNKLPLCFTPYNGSILVKIFNPLMQNLLLPLLESKSTLPNSFYISDYLKYTAKKLSKKKTLSISDFETENLDFNDDNILSNFFESISIDQETALQEINKLFMQDTNLPMEIE